MAFKAGTARLDGPRLGRLEEQVMDHLWGRGAPARVREVR